MNRSSGQKINKQQEALNDTLDQMDLVDISRAIHSKAVEYTFFSSVRATFFRIEHMLGHKMSLNKFKRTGIISGIFSDYNGMKLKINDKKKTEKHTNSWRQNKMPLNSEWVNNEIKGEN